MPTRTSNTNSAAACIALTPSGDTNRPAERSGRSHEGQKPQSRLLSANFLGNQERSHDQACNKTHCKNFMTSHLLNRVRSAGPAVWDHMEVSNPERVRPILQIPPETGREVGPSMEHTTRALAANLSTNQGCARMTLAAHHLDGDTQGHPVRCTYPVGRPGRPRHRRIYIQHEDARSA